MSSSARPSSSSSSVQTFSSFSTRTTTKSPSIPSRADSLHSSPPSPLIPPASPTSSTSFQTTPTSDKDIVGVNTVYSLGQAGERLEREVRLKKKGSWDEERELEEVLQEIGAGFDDGEFSLGGGGGQAAIPLSRAHSKKDKLMIVLGLPLPASASQPQGPSLETAASLPAPTSPSSPLPRLPSSLQRRPSSPVRSTSKLPTPPFTRRPSLPPPAPPVLFGGGSSTSTSNLKGPLSPTSLEKPLNGFSHNRRTSLNLGFGIALHLGGNSTAALSSPTGSSSSPSTSTHPIATSPRVTFHNNTSNHPSSSSSTGSLARSGTGNGSQSPLSTSMSSFSFGGSSSSHAKPRRGLVGSASSSSLREDPLSPGGGGPAPSTTKKSGSKRDLAGFLGRRRGEGEGHGMGRSISSSGVDAHGHRDKSPSMFPLQSLLKQTFSSSNSSSSSSSTSLHPQTQPHPRAPSPTSTPIPTEITPPNLLPPSSSSSSPTPPPEPSRTPTPTHPPNPIPSTHLLASALRIERLLSPNPSALALAASNPAHEFFLADPPHPSCLSSSSTLSSSSSSNPIFHHPTFSPYQGFPVNSTAADEPLPRTPSPSSHQLTDHDWINRWILTGVGSPSLEISRRVREERRRLPYWKGPSPLPHDDEQTLPPPSRSSSANTIGDGERGGTEAESSGEESGTSLSLATPSTSSPSFAQDQHEQAIGMGARELKIWEEKEKLLRIKRLGGDGALGVEEEVEWKEEEEERERREKERELMERLGGGGEREKRTRVKINLVPASPNGAANRF